METLTFRHMARRRLPGTKGQAIIGVVASGNLEVLLERVLPGTVCEVEIATPLTGYGETWKAVVAEFVERSSREACASRSMTGVRGRTQFTSA
jgi:malonate decarboxylase delta subunit